MLGIAWALIAFASSDPVWPVTFYHWRNEYAGVARFFSGIVFIFYALGAVILGCQAAEGSAQ